MKNIGSRIKDILIVVLALASLFFFFKSCVKEKEAGKLKAKDNAISKAIQTEAKIIARQTDGQGLQHVTAEDKNRITEKEAALPGILDTTALAIGILKKQISELTIISSTAQAEKLKAYAKLDSQKRLTYYYQDKFLSLAYRPPVNPADTIDKGEFDFKYNADLSITQYSKREWFLGTKKDYIDIYSNDPRTTVNGVKRLSIVRENPPKFRLQTSAIYSFRSQTFTPGLTGRLEFKRVSFSGSYFYNGKTDIWAPVIGFNYDLLRF